MYSENVSFPLAAAGVVVANCFFNFVDTILIAANRFSMTNYIKKPVSPCKRLNILMMSYLKVDSYHYTR